MDILWHPPKFLSRILLGHVCSHIHSTYTNQFLIVVSHTVKEKISYSIFVYTNAEQLILLRELGATQHTGKSILTSNCVFPPPTPLFFFTNCFHTLCRKFTWMLNNWCKIEKDSICAHCTYLFNGSKKYWITDCGHLMESNTVRLPLSKQIMSKTQW